MDSAVTRVLIVGASGLVGGRLLAALACDSQTLVRAASRVTRVWPDGVEGVVTSSSAPLTLAAACEGMDAVLNLASMPEAACAADPLGALRANVAGTLALASAAASAGVSRFVQLSTMKVYSNSPTGIITEETLTHPASHYAITHRAAEDYSSLHASAVVLRLANGFGAPIDPATPCWSLITNDFCRQAATTRHIVIRSDGLAWRNFIPLDDVVVALRAAATSLPAGTYNLGSARSMTLREMAERVAAVCEITLGHAVEVKVGTSTTGSHDEVLDYRTDRLRANGVQLADMIDDEIARTLLSARTALHGAERV